MRYIILLLCLILITGISAQKCPTQFSKCPPQAVIMGLGNSVTLECITKKEMDICFWQNPSSGDKSIRPTADNEYYERVDPDDKKSCSIKIKQLREVDHGNWTCAPIFPDASTETLSTPVFVTVGLPPTQPYISFKDKPNPGVIDVNEKELVSVECHVEQSRPQAEVRWFLGNMAKNLIEKDLTTLSETTTALIDVGNDVVKTTSALTYTFLAEHNRQDIWCTAKNLAITQDSALRGSSVLNVRYIPKFNSTMSTYTFEVNTKATVSVTYKANPSPQDDKDVKLIIDGRQSIESGKSNEILSLDRVQKLPGNADMYENIITFNELTVELTKQDYALSVTNRIHQPVMHEIVVEVYGSGEKDNYPYGLTAGIVIGVAVISGVLVYYAWKKSKWCFSPSDHKKVPANENRDKEMKDMSTTQPLHRAV